MFELRNEPPPVRRLDLSAQWFPGVPLEGGQSFDGFVRYVVVYYKPRLIKSLLVFSGVDLRNEPPPCADMSRSVGPMTSECSFGARGAKPPTTSDSLLMVEWLF